jgi:hypothetical protein
VVEEIKGESNSASKSGSGSYGNEPVDDDYIQESSVSYGLIQ